MRIKAVRVNESIGYFKARNMNDTPIAVPRRNVASAIRTKAGMVNETIIL